MSALGQHYSFKIFTRHALEDSFFDNVDFVCFPGGLGQSDEFTRLTKYHQQAVKQFVDRGGKYLGICMGAYWADEYYFNVLKDVRVIQYITQPDANTKRPHPKHMPVYWNGLPDHMFFYDGCTFTGGNYKIVAKYATDHPMAIIQDRIGLIGCHPESEKHWYDEYSWMPKHWCENHHKEMLLDFVNDI